MRVAWSPDYHTPLPQGHRFPMGKYPALLAALRREGLVRPDELFEPPEAAWEDLSLVHTPAYLSALARGDLSPAATRRLGLPWSRALLRRSRRVVAGTAAAARAALEDGLAANLAGGTHHAHPGGGAGFCVLNDVAVAVRVLRREGRLGRVLVVDLDVHQGDGTAAVFADDPDTATFSMHGARSFPHRKQRSTRDVGLPDRAGDDLYLSLLAHHLPEMLEATRPGLVFYLAGVDPWEGDRLGRLRLTRAGLAARERMVLGALRSRGLPGVLLPAGGYAPDLTVLADLHAEVHRAAREAEAPRAGAPAR